MGARRSALSRVVLLGASNLTVGLPTVLATTRARLGPGPHAIFVAAGHGRSYGRWSRIAFRGVPGILDCGLWSAALPRTGARTYALVTDIGNDLAYGASPAELAGWVAACLDHLTAGGAEVVLTLLPAHSIARLAPWQYHLFKALLFPGRRLSFPTIQARVAEVNARLATLAAGRRITVVEPEADWYGADAIHLRRSRHPAVWGHVLSRWTPASLTPATEPRRPVACRGLQPEWRTVLGVGLRRPQPSGVLDDGTTVSLY